MFGSLWLIIVYAPVTHWIWGGGWLAEMGILDYAGGLVVHLTAGISALVLAAALGPRKGFPDQVDPPHNPALVMIGASMLWVGWFGCMVGWRDGWMEGWRDGWMDVGWLHGCMGGWVDEWMG